MADSPDCHTADDEVPLAILFADMGGSTRLYEQLGDVAAHRIAARCIGDVEAVVAAHHGRVIKTIGDEVMSTFASADEAARAAREIQERATQAATVPAAGGGGPAGLHVGFHYGPVIVEAGDVFGDAVNVAARMVGLAKVGQILTTRETVDSLSSAERAQTRQIDHRTVKGKTEELDIFEVIWQTIDLTMVNPIPAIETSPPAQCLRLRLDDLEVALTPARPRVAIGRGAENDLVMPDLSASRQHAYAELRNGKFVLGDCSTNGTLVTPSGGEPVLLKREELILPGAGTIRVGNIDRRVGGHPISFHSEPWQPE